jgi:thiol:disulfide interchange protein DsbD
MPSLKFWPLILLASLLCTRPASAEDKEVEPIKVTLIATANGIEAGKTFTVVIHQKMRPGFHTYWQNPGTLGMALQMDWQLPPGFRAGPIQWPIPMITKMAAYNVWGYENEALLLVDMEAPANLKTGSTVLLSGTAIWMCCGKSCHPGGGELALTLPVVQKAQPHPSWEQAIRKTRAEQPVASPQWRLECKRKDQTYTLTVRHGSADPIRSLGQVRFFGYDRLVSSDQGERISHNGNSITLTMQHEEHTGDEKLGHLRGILVAEKDWETGRRVLEVDIPIRTIP